MEINELTGLILKKAYEVHTVLGPGLLESAYEECLCYELIQCGLNVEKQKALPVVYKNIKVDAGYRLDIVVNNAVIIEINAYRPAYTETEYRCPPTHDLRQSQSSGIPERNA